LETDFCTYFLRAKGVESFPFMLRRASFW